MRDIINKDDLIDYLKNKNFMIIDPSKLDFLQQIKIFNSSKIIIGLYGAGLTNVIFCKKGTTIIELKNNYTDNVYKNISKAFNLKYYNLISNKVVSDGSKRSWDGHIDVNIKKLSKITG